MWEDKYMKVKGNWFISFMFTLLEKYDAEVYVEVYLNNWKTLSGKTLNIFHKCNGQEMQFDLPFISYILYWVCYRITVQLSTWERLAHLILWTTQVSPVQLSLFLSIFPCSHLSRFCQVDMEKLAMSLSAMIVREALLVVPLQSPDNATMIFFFSD